MSFNVLPFGSAPGPEDRPAPKPAQDPADGAAFAEVVDLAAHRDAATGTPEIPDDVWDEVEAASRLWHELRAENREVRFDADEATGRVVASLRDLDGDVVRPLPLRETLGMGDPGPETAA